MADVVYKVEFKVVDEKGVSGNTPSDTKETEKIRDKSPKKTEEITKKEFNTQAFAKFMTFYGAYQTVANIHQKMEQASLQARGDNLKAVMKSEEKALTNSLISSGLNIVGGFMVGGVVGAGAMLGMEVYKLANSAINISIENQKRLNQIIAERHIANNEQERFVRNATTERIRVW